MKYQQTSIGDFYVDILRCLFDICILDHCIYGWITNKNDFTNLLCIYNSENKYSDLFIFSIEGVVTKYYIAWNSFWGNSSFTLSSTVTTIGICSFKSTISKFFVSFFIFRFWALMNLLRLLLQLFSFLKKCWSGADLKNCSHMDFSPQKI